MRTVFRNGTIYNGRHATKFTTCSTMVINNDLIEYMGDDADRRTPESTSEAGDRVIDLDGKSVFSSFVDGHMHLLFYGASMVKVGLDDCQNLDDIRRTISDAAKSMPDAPRILCRGWRQATTQREALASALDDLDPRPIYIDADDIHSAWCNSAALREMGITAQTPDPMDGTIHRDSNGDPTGLISEGAVITLVWPFMIGLMSVEERMEAIRMAIKEYHLAGYTAVIEMAMDEHTWNLLETMRDMGQLNIRIAAHWLVTPTSPEAQVQTAIDMHTKYNLSNSPNFRIAGIKVICDGVVDACTAGLAKPYLVDPYGCGQLNWTLTTLQKVVAQADDAGLQVACHAIGDAAISMAIQALETSGTVGSRHRIEHVEVTHPDDAKRLGQLGIIASVQPAHSDPGLLTAWPELIGLERCEWAFPHKEFLEHGAHLAIGTDVPTGPQRPLPNLYVANTRQSARHRHTHWKINQRQGLEMHQVFSAASWGSAYSCFAEEMIGSLEVGKKADFIVVDGLQGGLVAEHLLDAAVTQTWLDGQQVCGS